MNSNLSHKALRADLKARLASLAAEVDATRQCEGFREVLRTAARFWEYSLFNQFLIVLQRPGARRVTGRKSWEAMGRRIRRGGTAHRHPGTDQQPARIPVRAGL